jgi:lysophospholipase L1-like esterase
MPEDFNPRVWWLVLGMNDLGRMQCSEEVVVLGILRVVEEIRTRKPDAEIVINSMLPMADLRGGVMPQMIDYKDAFQTMGRGQMVSANANPALYARPPGAAAGLIVDGMAKVTYQRPLATTTALRNRHKGAIRGQVPGPGGMGPGPMRPPPPGPNMGTMTPGVVPPQGDGGAPKKQAMSMAGDDRHGRQLKKKDDEEETGEDADAPKKTKKEIKAEKKYIKKVKKDPVNPKLNLEKTKIKVRDPKKLFLAKNRLPLWTSINAINKQLRKFADKHEKITFFDATSIFAERSEENKYVLQSNKISLRGHPTLVGFAEWEEAVAIKLKKMFETDDVELAKEAAAAEQAEKQKAAAEAAAAKSNKGASSSEDDDKTESDKKDDSNDADDDKN